jgi:hypothetical protein
MVGHGWLFTFTYKLPCVSSDWLPGAASALQHHGPKNACQPGLRLDSFRSCTECSSVARRIILIVTSRNCGISPHYQSYHMYIMLRDTRTSAQAVRHSCVLSYRLSLTVTNRPANTDTVH